MVVKGRNFAFQKKILEVSKKIKDLKEKILHETDPMIKNIFISMRNTYIYEIKDLITQKICNDPNLQKEFEILNKEIIAKNKAIDENNDKIIKKNPYLRCLLSLIQGNCLKKILEAAQDHKITEPLSQLEEFLIPERR